MKVNGKIIEIASPVNLKLFLEQHGYDVAKIAVEMNGNIVPKKTFENTIVNDSDTLEVVRFVGGG